MYSKHLDIWDDVNFLFVYKLDLKVIADRHLPDGLGKNKMDTVKVVLISCLNEFGFNI